jgi:uncharacterized hydrophobic protein (TIGR00271 family)
MCVAIVIPDNWDPARLVHWSTAIARAKSEDLLIISSKRQAHRSKRKKAIAAAAHNESPLAAAIRRQAGDFALRNLDLQDEKAAARAVRHPDASARCIFVRQLDHANLVGGVLKAIRLLRVSTLIIPRHRGVRFGSDEFAAERQLLLEASCETLQLRPGQADRDTCRSVLVASDGRKDASPALHLGAKLAASKAAGVTALYVNQNVGFPVRSDAQEIVERFVQTSLKEKAHGVTSDAVVDSDVPQGLRSYATDKGHDLIVVGRATRSTAEAPSRDSVSEKLLTELEDRTVVVVRKALPVSGRLLRSSERLKNRFVPQLEREGRLELVNRLHASSKSDFDFFFLIAVATMLAALGLALDSPPVVIGAMLVAPLMTPMLGVGLSVVQGNRFMAGGCLATIRRGFLVAFLTGCAVGVIRLCFTTDVTQEMSNRGSPGVLDLFVAFVSGGVAAYAFGRPHLLSVVPGIAIATSLVPPVATAGLSLSTWQFDLAFGATLLFLTNFVAIVLGSATCLWFVGMRGPRKFCPFATWARRLILGMSLAAVALAVYSSVETGRAQPSSAAIVAMDLRRSASNASKVTRGKPAEAPEPGDALAGQEDLASAQLLARQELEDVEVVLETRPADGREPATADVTLIVPNEQRTVELEGIVAEQRSPDWVTLDLPERDQWARETRWLTSRQKAGLESPDFYRVLEKHIARRFAAEQAKPM